MAASNSTPIAPLSPKHSLSHDSEPVATSVTKRLTSELMALMMADNPGVSAFPVSDGNMTYWSGQINGAEGTVYAGLSFKISLTFPPSYPYQAPVVKFESPCYHPNVDVHGNICLDILKEKWSAVLSVSTILVSLQSLLGEPNNDSPLNMEAAELWDNPTRFKEELMKHYRPFEEL